MIKQLCAKCGDTVASHNLYGCCAEPLESSLSCGNSYRKCAECTGHVTDIVPNVNNKLSNHCKNCGNENWARITADPSGITYCNECELIR